MAQSDTGLVDLVCGPDSPLPEGRQRYRLLGHLGAGGQAEVYRGVRLSAGVRSSPVTVKVFRHDPRRPMLAQLRSWDKGDAVLMDLNSREVAGICLRVDGFYGAPPSPIGTADRGEHRIPFQVLDYLPGFTVLQHLASNHAPRLNGVRVLETLANTLRSLHHPDEAGDSPVVHMDVKPSNVLVLPDGEVRLIDFTAARYHDPGHITTIAHTPESGGPEAYTGQVGPSYDVHGFGAVAFFLVTGWLPRAERLTPPQPGVSVKSPSQLRRHPLLDAHPDLAAHLLAPLADQPENRPRTTELVGWSRTLGQLAARLGEQHAYVDWDAAGGPHHPAPTMVALTPPAAQPPAGSYGGFESAPPSSGAGQPGYAAPGGAPVPPAPVPFASAPGRFEPSPATAKFEAPQSAPPATARFEPPSSAPPATARYDAASPATARYEPASPPTAKYDAASPPTAKFPPQSGPPATTPGQVRMTPGLGSPPVPSHGSPAMAGNAPALPPAEPKKFTGKAQVRPKAPPQPDPRDYQRDEYPPAAPPEPRYPPPNYPMSRRGRGWTKFGIIAASSCWLLWLLTVAILPKRDWMDPLTAGGLAVVGAVIGYWLTRLAGHLIRSTLDKGPRKGTFVPHLVTTLVLVLCAIGFFTQAKYNASDVVATVQDFLVFWD